MKGSSFDGQEFKWLVKPKKKNLKNMVGK